MAHDVTDVTVEYDDAGVRRTIYTLPPSSSKLPSVAAFSLPKAGSVLLNSVMSDLSDAVGLTYVSIMSEFFALGLIGDNIPPSTERIFRERGYCYGGFREFPSQFEMPNYLTQSAVLLVRDPRDMVVSHYFSARYSHPKPGTKKVLSTGQTSLSEKDIATQLPLDEYVIAIAGNYQKYIRSYFPILDSVAFFKYEDILFDKRKWLLDMCRHFGWDVSGAVIRDIADQNDRFPDSENATMHVRQALPGDFRRKLRGGTIARLNEIFSEELRLFGYDQQPRLFRYKLKMWALRPRLFRNKLRHKLNVWSQHLLGGSR